MLGIIIIYALIPRQGRKHLLLLILDDGLVALVGIARGSSLAHIAAHLFRQESNSETKHLMGKVFVKVNVHSLDRPRTRIRLQLVYVEDIVPLIRTVFLVKLYALVLKLVVFGLSRHLIG